MHIEQTLYINECAQNKFVIDPGNTYFGGSPHLHIHGFRNICQCGDSQNNVFPGSKPNNICAQSVTCRFVSKCMVDAPEAWVGGLVERPSV
jgi:hypothetical protein